MSVLPWSPRSPLQPLQLRLFRSGLCLLAGLMQRQDAAALHLRLACCMYVDLREHESFCTDGWKQTVQPDSC